MFGKEIYNEFCKKYNINESKIIEDIISNNSAIFEKPLSQFEECVAIDLIMDLSYNIFGASLNASDFKVITNKNTVISYEGPTCYINDNAFNNYYF